MKRGLFILLLALLISVPLIFAQETQDTTNKVTTSSDEDTKTERPKTDPWNETIVLSPVLQKIFQTFFGLNLQKEQQDLTVTEVIVFFMIFAMFFTLALNIFGIILPKNKILFIRLDIFLIFIITVIASMLGALIPLKNLSISLTTSIVEHLDWAWLNFALQHKVLSIFIMFWIIPVIIGVNEAISWLKPYFTKQSQISKAKASGRLLANARRNMERQG